ncbi:MAG: sigma-54-dependent Fis family transcriptional regulator [Kofleriaceae bacterium]|nr:sigma-54-dependent Fis family transcriptional regulator [Myxococcales bacterium]MCB9570924.1 sigma-54-dependent Fis family transcriptional regulator [Kofleriaceae bacterium]
MPDGHAATILVVEDDDAMRDLLVEELRDAGHRVLAAPGGSLALDLARAEPPDLMITDLRMPDLDGFDLIRDITALPNPPHIVMITAFGSIETAIKAVKLGAYDYITKPFEIDQLLLVVGKALGERELRRKVARLQREVERQYGFENIIARSEAMKEVLALVSRIAGSTASVLVTGESGTGKELIARAIHYNSPRAQGPFVAVNLAAVPESLIESELFGHKKGAFTDARADRDGLFAEADGGTIFLDEIGELALPLQAKLLRVLQEHELRPLGATKTQRVDVRVVAATNRNLESMLTEGSFREDLYYRLNVIQLDLPPLRSRPEDVLPLSEHFLAQLGAKHNPPRQLRLTTDAQQILLGYAWPGNVRELHNVLERGVALCQAELIRADDLPNHVRERKPADFLQVALARRMSLAELEREYIERVLDDEGGNKTRAAQRLGLDRKTLYRKLEEYARSPGATDPAATAPGVDAEES